MPAAREATMIVLFLVYMLWLVDSKIVVTRGVHTYFSSRLGRPLPCLVLLGQFQNILFLNIKGPHLHGTLGRQFPWLSLSLS